MNERRACFLGAVNGLLVGLAAQELNFLYEKYELRRWEAETLLNYGRSAYTLEPWRDMRIVPVCVVTFVCVAYLFHRYFINRPSLLLAFWAAGGMATGAVSFILGNDLRWLSRDFTSALCLIGLIAAVYLAYRSWLSRPCSALLIWQVIGVSAVILSAVIAQIARLFTAPRYEFTTPLFWFGYLGLVAVINLAYGVVLQSSSKTYLR